MGSNWNCDYQEMKKLLKQLDAYVQARDWKNARHISKILQFKVQFCTEYEREKVEQRKVNL